MAATAVTAVLAALSLGGCADAGPAQGNESSKGETLKVATASASSNYAPFWIALQQKLFEKHGVKVDLVNANGLGTMPALLASGQIDIALTNPAQIAQLALQGKPAQVIYNMENFTGRVLSFVGSSKVSSIDDLIAKGNDCKVAATGPGTAAYAYTKSLMAQKGIKCQITQFATNPLVLAAVTSGRADAGPLTAGDAATAVSKGAHVLSDPSTLTDEQAKEIVPDETPVIVVGGLSSDLSKHSDAVEKFLAAILEASKLFENQPLSTSAEQLVKTGYFTGLTADQVTTGLGPIFPTFSLGDSAGEISEDLWQTTLDQYATLWELPNFDKDAPEVSYSQMIDMGYLEAARKGA